MKEVPSIVDPQEGSVDFLVAEFNALQQRAIQAEQAKATSTNFYLIIVAALFAGLFSIIDKLSSLFPIVSIGACIFTSATDFLTLDYSINQSIIAIMLYRRAGRIRRWFAISNPHIRSFLPFEPNDGKPSIHIPMLGLRGLETILFVLNIASSTLAVNLVLFHLLTEVMVFGACGTAYIVCILQRMYVQRKLHDAEYEAQRRIRFPRVIDKQRSA